MKSSSPVVRKLKRAFFQWHGLSREEQAKYYELARKERQLHMQLYPGWSARDNYAMSKKKKRKRLMQHQQREVSDGAGALPMKMPGVNVATPRLSGGRMMETPIKCDGNVARALMNASYPRIIFDCVFQAR